MHHRVEYIREKFESFGEILDVYMPKDYHTRRPKGFCFVEYTEESSAEEAEKTMNGSDFDGRNITVQPAKDGRKDRSKSSY